MYLSRLQCASDFTYEYFSLFPADLVFSCLCIKIGISVLQLLGCDEEYLVREISLQFIVLPVYEIIQALKGSVNAAYNLVEVFLGSVLTANNLFPVPLIYINLVKIVKFLIPPYGIHVSVQSGARLESVFAKGHSLPLCQ